MDRYLLIAGQGRAGSTLFYNMMRHALRGFHMPESEVRALDWMGQPGNVCTKRPFDIFDIPKIAQAAGQAGKTLDLIVTLRDPRDILTSRHSRVPGEYFYGADKCFHIYPDRAPTLTAPGFLPVHKAILDAARSELFPQGIFFLKYEDLVAHPDEVQAVLANQMNLPFQGDFRDFHTQKVSYELDRAMNGTRALDTSRQAKWRQPEHRARIVDQFTRFPVLHDILISLGYEANRDWFDTLVQADEAETAA